MNAQVVVAILLLLQALFGAFKAMAFEGGLNGSLVAAIGIPWVIAVTLFNAGFWSGTCG